MQFVFIGLTSCRIIHAMFYDLSKKLRSRFKDHFHDYFFKELVAFFQQRIPLSNFDRLPVLTKFCKGLNK